MVSVAGQKSLSRRRKDAARRVLGDGDATRASEASSVLRPHALCDLPESQYQDSRPLRGQRALLHICCGPCATYTVKRLASLGADVSGYWFNPNIHPYSEHGRRREALAAYAREIELPIIWEAGYEMPAFLRAVAGHEQFRERCLICYRMRLERTARIAAEGGFELYTTTLLISPYQDQGAIRQIGEEVASSQGISFYYENFRRGFTEHHRLAQAHNLYRQRYCGCLYSEWEAQDRRASTHLREQGRP